MKTWYWLSIICLCLCLLGFGHFSQAAEAGHEDDAYHRAVQLFNQRDWDASRKSFEEFQRGFPHSRWQYAVQLRLADLESDPARSEKAYQDILAAAANTEWAVDARWSLANVQFSLGKFSDAATHFMAIAQNSDPRSARALYLAGICRLALKDYKPAKVLFNRVNEQFADSAWDGPALAGLGDAELESENARDALQAYDRYLKKYPAGELIPYIQEQRAKALEALGMQETPPRVAANPPAGAGVRPTITVPGQYTIQVGAFTKKEYAANLVKKLKQRGYPAYILPGHSGAEILHQVRIGEYSKRLSAEEVSKNLEKKEKLPAMIVLYSKPVK